ncbi:MAG: hypothetical protein ACK50P_04625 [Planctomycetaceae bacterium]|jgi:DNA-binding beta-propeller fold protein YncE
MRLAVFSICLLVISNGWMSLWFATTPLAAAAEWQISTVAGTGEDADNGVKGSADRMNVAQPFGVEIGPDQALYLTEVGHHRIWKLNRETREMTVVAGTGQKGYSGDGGPATGAAMNEPYEIRFDRDGHMYVVEMQNHLVRRIDARSGRIETIAGMGEPGFSGDDGPATKARLKVPHGIVLDGKGGLYIADIGNHRIRRVDLATGVIRTVAGTGETTAVRSDVPSWESPLPGPRALACDGKSLWVVLREGHAVWRMDLETNRLDHIGGTGKAGYTGDGGPARQATFHGPKGLAVDSQGRLFIVDSENDAVRLLDPRSGMVETIAGRGKSRKFSGDGGPARAAELSQPHGICLDRDGNVYIGDTGNHRVRKISPGR